MKPKRRTKTKGLSEKGLAANIFSGLDSRRPQQFGRAVRQPNHRGGR